MNRRIKEGEEGSQFHFSSAQEGAVKGEKPTSLCLLCLYIHGPTGKSEQQPGDDVLQIEVRVSLYEPLVKTFRQQVGIQKRENRKYPLLWSG